MSEEGQVEGPDLSLGVREEELPDGGTLLGHVGNEPVFLARRGDEIFAMGASCSHYGGKLSEGLLVGNTVRCPLHHAEFCLRSGRAKRPPAFSPLRTYQVKKADGKLVVGSPNKLALAPPEAPDTPIQSVVIVGGGAAGHAAAEALYNLGYDRRIVLLSADNALPYDRPNLSKDYLAGQAPEEWLPLPPGYYQERGIDVVLDTHIAAINLEDKLVVDADGMAYLYDALLLATGAEPVRLTIPGADLPHVHYLRSVADSRAIIAKLPNVKRAVVLGASFIGLEVAASLRARGIDVRVVAPDERPLERVLGPELGEFIQGLHTAQGVEFHLGRTASRIEAKQVVLDDGTTVEADLVVAGIGVRPATALAEAAGIATDRGILVNEYLETSAPGVYAAGDVARYPDPRSGERVRIEHWVVAQRQAQIAAENLLGGKRACDLVPFFWSHHYDLEIAYVGHAEKWDRISIDGSLEKRDAAVSYWLNGKLVAKATIGRNLESLRTELELESSVSS